MLQSFLLSQYKASIKQKTLFLFFLLMFSLVAATSRIQEFSAYVDSFKDQWSTTGVFTFFLLLFASSSTLYLAHWSNSVTSPSEDVEPIDPLMHLYAWALLYLTLNYFCQPYDVWIDIFNSINHYRAGSGLILSS